MATQIPLTRGKVAIVDDEDVALVSGWNWYACKQRDGGTWYAYGRPKRTSVSTTSMHFVIMGRPSGKQADHRDGDGLNNRKSNLRISTHGQNRANSRTRNAIGFKGVTKRGHRFQALIRHLCKIVNLGMHDTAESAANAYDAAARRLHGEFASLNFPRPGERSAITGKIEPAPPLATR